MTGQSMVLVARMCALSASDPQTRIFPLSSGIDVTIKREPEASLRPPVEMDLNHAIRVPIPLTSHQPLERANRETKSHQVGPNPPHPHGRREHHQPQGTC